MGEKYILLMGWHMQLLVVTTTVEPQETLSVTALLSIVLEENGELTLECYQNRVNCVKDFRLYPIGT